MASLLKMISVRLFKADYELIQTHYPAAGANKVIRTLVHAHCQKLRERDNQLKASATDLEDLTVELES